MIKKYTYGTPFPTESVTEQFAASEGMPEFGDIHLQEGFSFTYKLRDEDVVYGLGEANRGINKRGSKSARWLSTRRISRCWLMLRQRSGPRKKRPWPIRSKPTGRRPR